MSLSTNIYKTQNDLLLATLMRFYENRTYFKKMLSIINGETRISLRIVDWFVTNYAKKYFTVYENPNNLGEMIRFKVYNEYKLKLKAYSKQRFDSFCRWERIMIPFDEETNMETTLGQLNFFKWAIENRILEFIEENYEDIERDMNTRNSTSRRNDTLFSTDSGGKTRKKREELSVSACKCIKKETVKIVVRFN
jgi:hypothetical protein